MSSTVTPAPTRAAPPPPIWQCSIRTVKCRYGHPRIEKRDATIITEYRVDGHIYLTCPRCRPSSHAFGVATRYHRLITFYDITKDQLHRILALPDDVETIEILALLGYGGRDAT
jgi:hypothetical protein